MLVVLSGLPGVGTSTIARELAPAMEAVYVRVDSIEQVLRHAGCKVEGEGYAVARAAGADRTGVRALNVEVVCSNIAEHRRRVESRSTEITGHHLPAWSQVEGRDYRPWDSERLTIDTASSEVRQSVESILAAVGN